MKLLQEFNMSTVIASNESRDTYLRTKNRFYVAGWFANANAESPQVLPESCKGDLDVVKQYADYLDGYGDSLANGECLTEIYEQFYS
jgi:hypothetical protein